MSAHREEAGGLHAHRRAAPRSLRVAVITVSDTRTEATDTGGAFLVERLEGAGHRVGARRIVPDEIGAIRGAVEDALADPEVEVVLLTGGTGVAPRDVTPEAVEPLLERRVPGFGELFRVLSHREIGAAAILSRALLGIARGRVLAALPGSRGALRLALDELLLPELGHLVGEARKQP